jgi:hypothetical protein
MLTNRARRGVRKLFILFVLTVPLLVVPPGSRGQQDDPECEMVCQEALSECLLACEWCGNGWRIMCQQNYQACSQGCDSE